VRRRLLILLAGTAALAAPALTAHAAMEMPGGAGGAAVSIGFDAYQPAQVDALAGESVQWMNDSARQHTVTAEDGSYDSGRLGLGASFTRTYDTPGVYRIYCRLHPSMRGEVDVHRVLLDAPGAPAGAGRVYPLRGRAALPAGSPVSIQADSGTGYAEVAQATVGDDGTFTAALQPRASASYRAVAGDDTSPAVQLLVLDHAVRANVTRGARRVVVQVQVTPAAPGGTVVLQLRLRDRFGWWPLITQRLDSRSRARFVVGARRGVPARVLLTLPDGATELARSRTLDVAPRQATPRARA